MNFKKEFENYRIEMKSPAGMAENSFFEYGKKYTVQSQFNPNLFLVGKLYTFFYDSIPEKNQFVNRRPLLFFLGRDKTSTKPTVEGLDIMLLPPLDRLNFMIRIFSSFGSIIERNMEKGKDGINSQEQLNVDYKSIESLMVGINYKNSFYKFSLDKMKGVHEIPYSEWHKMVYLNTRSILGTTLEEIYKKMYRI
jgi:hypothetical protein